MGVFPDNDEELTVSDAQTVSIGGGQGGNFVGRAAITQEESAIRINGRTFPAVNFVNSSTATLSTSGDQVMINTTGGGGGHPSIPIERANITLSVSEREAGSPAITVTGTLSTTSPYTFVGTGSNNGSGGVDTLSVTGGAAAIVPTHVNLTDTAFSFPLSVGDQATNRTISVSATLYATYNSAIHSQVATARIDIALGWYSAFTATQPTALTSMTNQGVYTSPRSFTQTVAATGGRTLYLALPTRTDGYIFQSGPGYLSNVNRGVIGSGFTLYELTDITDGQVASITFTITGR